MRNVIVKIKAALIGDIAIVGLFIVFGTGMAAGQPTGAQSAASSGNTQNYRIGPGDVIDVIVSQSAALSRTGIRVNNEGLITLPMLDNDIHAGCKTERELAD